MTEKTPNNRSSQGVLQAEIAGIKGRTIWLLRHPYMAVIKGAIEYCMYIPGNGEKPGKIGYI